MLLAVLNISAQGVPEEVAASSASHPASIVASTSWTAAFADLGGLDDVAFIAPATLTHPPEYEITVSDVVKINHADYFIFAGYERMMQSMGTSIKKDEGTMLQITTTNDIENVKKQAATIASITGTEEKSETRLASYIATIEEGGKTSRGAWFDRGKGLLSCNAGLSCRRSGPPGCRYLRTWAGYCPTDQRGL